MTEPELAEVRQQIRDHRAHRLYLDNEAFLRSLENVFGANTVELYRLLDQAASDTDLAIELVQNAHDDPIRREFNARLDQRLHNYLASTQSIVDHARRLLDKDNRRRLLDAPTMDAIRSGFASRRNAVQEGGLMAFVIELRNYTQH